MWIKQMTVEDWLQMFLKQPETEHQVEIIEARIHNGSPLATWEHNCLKAYRQLHRIAAE